MANFDSTVAWRSVACFAAALLVCGASMAQVHKCVGKDGKVTYEQTPCAGGSSAGGSVNLQGAGQARPAASSPASSAAPNAYDASVKQRISALVADKDFVRAQALAVTDEHRKMVADAKKANEADEQEKAKARAARGAVDCLTYREWVTGPSGGIWAERKVCK